MNKPQNTEPRHKDVWTYIHAGLAVEIVHHSKSELVNEGKGIWCYYVYVPEERCKPGVFEALWKEDKKVHWYPTGP